MFLNMLAIWVLFGTILCVCTDANVPNNVHHPTLTSTSPALNGVADSGSPFSSFLSTRFGDSVGSTQTCVNWNSVADILLGIFREDLRKSGTIRITIPPIEKEFTHKVAGINLKGKLIADRGWFSDLSSLQRTGNVEITTAGNVVTLKCSLGLGIVKFGYDHYDVKVVHVGPSGHFSGSVGSNSIEITLQVDAGQGDCKVVLNQIRVVELRDLKMTVTGFGGLLNNSVSKIANEAIQKRKGDIIKQIEKSLAEEVKKKVDSVHCGQYFSMMVNNI